MPHSPEKTTRRRPAGRPTVIRDQTQVIARLPGRDVQRLDAMAAERGLTRSDVLREAVRAYVERTGRE